jgi:hypothetical protein
MADLALRVTSDDTRSTGWRFIQAVIDAPARDRTIILEKCEEIARLVPNHCFLP